MESASYSISFMLKQSLLLLVLGMAIVFAFLSIMIIFINLFHLILKRTSGESNDINATAKKNIEKDFEKGEGKLELETKTKDMYQIDKKGIVNNHLVAAIFTAIKLYEQGNKKI